MADDNKKDLLQGVDTPEGVAEAVINAAADMSGKPAEDLTLSQAVEILQGDNPNPILNSFVKHGEKTAEKVLEGITDDQAAQLKEALKDGSLQSVLAEIIQESAQQKLEMFRATAEETLREMIDPATAISTAFSTAQENLKNVAEIAAPAFTAMREFFHSDTWKTLQEIARSLAQAAPAWLELAKDVEELNTYLEAELQKPQYEGKSIDDLFEKAEFDDDGNPKESSLFMQALTAAKEARKADLLQQEPQSATIKKTNKIDYPVDKYNHWVWDLTEADTAGQIEFNMAKSGSKRNVPAYYSIDFDGLSKDVTITKRLLLYDKRVYVAVAALFNAGNNVITLTQIYKHMGYTGKPGEKDLSRINQSILKMLGAQIYINNEAEAETYKGYNKFIYRGSLLPIETGETYNVQGSLTNAAIHIFREPPLISFARQRKQITTVDLKLLQSPINKTEANLQIDDYLIERISKAKHGKGHSCRILFKTIFARAGIITKKQQQRAPKKIYKYLNHYQECGYISKYTEQKDGITVFWK